MFPIGIVSWNIHGAPLAPRIANRLRFIADRILALDSPASRIDFVLFQEVWFPSHCRLIIDLLSPRYVPVSVPEGMVLGDSGGLISFVHRDSSWSVARRSFHRFDSSGPTWRLWEGDGIGNKGVEQIDLSSDGTKLTVLNTHFQAQYGQRTYATVRDAQSSSLQKVAETVPRSVPVIACGDLNTRPSEANFRTIDDYWVDLTADYRRECGCGTSIADPGPEQWLDFVLARSSPNWTIEKPRVTRIVNQQPDDPFSDHHGLAVWLGLQSKHVQAIPLALALAIALRTRQSRRQVLLAPAAALCHWWLTRPLF